MDSDRIGVILLAAGASVRLGRAKQTLEFQNQTLLRRSAETALKVTTRVVVMLGARVETLRTEIVDLPVSIIENKDWKSGMGGSLKIGLENLMQTVDHLEGAIIMVCDQPFVTDDLLEKFVAEHARTNALIVASQYADTRGVPAFFAAKLFPELLALEPPHGAKFLIEKYRKLVASVAFPAGAFDIDTPDDYENLIKKFA